MMKSESQWSTTDGHNIYSRSWLTENPQGMIVIVHGTGDHVGRFDWLARQWNFANYSVFGADFRGNGRSEGTRGFAPSFEVLLDDLDQMLERAKSVADLPVFLYGQSMGGLLSLYLPMKREVELAGIIASSPAMGLALKPPGWKLAIGRTLGKFFPKMSLPSGIQIQQLTGNQERQKEFEADSLRHRRMCANTFFSMMDTMKQCQQWDQPLNLPVLIMHGEADGVTCAEESRKFAARIGCDFKSWPGLLHELHQEDSREEVARFAIDWIDEQVG